MTNNLNQYPYPRDEIDLHEIIKVLMESKKLIALTILIFTIASIIYSLSLKPEFKSSSILEIGYSELPYGTQKSIEEPSDLISNLNLYQFLNLHDQNQVTSFEAIENKLILIETNSDSAEKNENLLTDLINYIDERHSNIAASINDQQKSQIYNEIDLLKSELSFIKSKQLESNQLKRLEIEDRIIKLKTELPTFDLEISQLEKLIIDDTNNLSLIRNNNSLLELRAANSPTLEEVIFNYKSKINSLNSNKNTTILKLSSLDNQLKNLENVALQSDEIFSLEQKQKTLENQLQILMTQTQVNTRLIGNIETDTIKPKTLLTILLGLIFGFITSIVLVFIRRFVISYKDSQA